MNEMNFEIGKQYFMDDAFKAKARVHQSNYRASVLKVDFNEYGNRLTDEDAKLSLNYYGGLGVIETKNLRYPNYSKTRDADMLRSEHIPFNIFVPLKNKLELATQIFKTYKNLQVKEVVMIEIEYAPKDKRKYLDDATSFDAYIEFINNQDKRCGLGVEVKYTEQAYKLTQDSSEYLKVNNKNSKYHIITNESNKFVEGTISEMIKDDFRQIWRNYILGLSMVKNNELEHFYSMTLYPSGNIHFADKLPKFLELIQPEFKNEVFGETFENFFEKLKLETSKLNDEEYDKWVHYLNERYLF